MPLEHPYIVLFVAAASGVFAYSMLFGSRIDPSVAHLFLPFDSHMKVNEINFNNDPKVNKAWWDNQHRRKDRYYENPTAKDFTDTTWY